MWILDDAADRRDSLMTYAACYGHSSEPVAQRAIEIDNAVAQVMAGYRWECQHDREAVKDLLRDHGFEPEHHVAAVEHLAHDLELFEDVRRGDVEIEEILAYSCEADQLDRLEDALIETLLLREEEDRRLEIADEIQRWAQTRGHRVHQTMAETGSQYVVIDDWLKVRISDHGPLYECHVDVSPFGHGDVAGAIKEIEELLKEDR